MSFCLIWRDKPAGIERRRGGRPGWGAGEIVTAVNRVTSITAGIAAASQEQSQGIAQVSKAVVQMDHAIQQNAVQAEELASTSQLLAGQAQPLQTLVGRFKLAYTDVITVHPSSSESDPAGMSSSPSGQRSLGPTRSGRSLLTEDGKVSF